MSELLVEFRASTREKVFAAANALLTIPALSERSLAGAEIGYSSRARILSAHLRFDRERFTDRPRERVTFWCARAGGLVRPPDGSRLSAELVLPDVAPSGFAAAVNRISAATGHEIALSPPLAPCLVVDMGGPAAAEIVYAAATRQLFVPCPVAPPVGDALLLEVILPPPGRQRVRSFARVAEVRACDAASPGRPAGFALALDSDHGAAHGALAALVPNGSSGDRAAVPRLRTVAPAGVEPTRCAVTLAPGTLPIAAHLRDLSHRGAFIHTTRVAPLGSRVRISSLPCGDGFESTAHVVRVTSEGMAVQFRLDPQGEARLAAALTSMAGRPRRVLIVDDDALARRMLADSFEECGLDVLTARDGELGLRVLAEEILSLDALVSDVRMPGVDGEAFVRRIRGPGGEHDLPIVVVTATLDDALSERMHAAGADRALPKSLGPDLIVEATLAEISSRRGCAGSPVSISAE